MRKCSIFLDLVRAAGPAASLVLLLVLGGDGAGLVLVLVFFLAPSVTPSAG